MTVPNDAVTLVFVDPPAGVVDPPAGVVDPPAGAVDPPAGADPPAGVDERISFTAAAVLGPQILSTPFGYLFVEPMFFLYLSTNICWICWTVDLTGAVTGGVAVVSTGGAVTGGGGVATVTGGGVATVTGGVAAATGGV